MGDHVTMIGCSSIPRNVS